MGFVNNTTGYSGNGFVRLSGSSRGYLRTAEGYPCVLINCRENPLKKLTVYGNTVQNGTPSPDNPAELQGVGDRTSNLFDIQTVSENVLLSADGISTSNDAWNTSDYIPATPGNYTVYEDSGKYFQARMCFYDSSKAFLSSKIISGAAPIKPTYAAPENTAYLRLSYSVKVNGVPVERINLRINSGNEILPYEPYGYKVPLQFSGENGERQSFNVYLDEQLNTGDTLSLNVENRTAAVTRRFQLAEPVTSDIKISWDTIPELWRGTVTITLGTQIPPSNITAEYYAGKK